METHLSALFALDDLAKEIAGGYVSSQTHPTLPLRILNYTPAAQYDRRWNDVTTQCRGLIIDPDDNVVARPFAKFFNYGEIDMLPDLPASDPIVSEKMDGSLGIIYTYRDYTGVATRGSFASEQAFWATDWLHTNMEDFAQPEGVTTLVEIIYPSNRIVVDYHGAEGLWLLGAIDNATGADILVEDITWWSDGRIAPQYGYTSIDKAVRMGTGDQMANDEGVVLTWPRDGDPSLRIKVKHPRYVELHRIVTGLSTRTIHEALSNNTFDEIIDAAPDEFHPWIRQVAAELRNKYDEIAHRAQLDLYSARIFADALSDCDPRDFACAYSRKDLAGEINKYALYPGLCFALEDGRPIDGKIWDMIRPERTTAMIIDTDNGEN